MHLGLDLRHGLNLYGDDVNGLSIGQVAERTKFSPSTLRFYEQSGLVRPDRTPSGYRSYGEKHLELLGFIRRAKGFGLSLDEIIEVLGLLGEDRCAPVQGRLRELIDAKIVDAHLRIGELSAFAEELRRVSTGLRDHTPDGPCDADCGCTVERPSSMMTDVGFAATRRGQPDKPVACSLPPGDVWPRVTQWRAHLAAASARIRIPGGVRATFPPGTDLAALAAIVAAEHQCCLFLSFTISVDALAITLDVTGPADALPMITELAGLAS
jgi:DNA-binding transcriptional MerR regulator